MQADTFHDQFTRLPQAEIIPYWQGSGTDYSFTNVSKINVTSAGGNSVEAGGILGVMFDRDAVVVANLNRRTTTHYNAKAEFWNNWAKADMGLITDEQENFVVFFVA